MRNLGNKVSRVLPAEERSFTGVVFQPLRPPLDSEWNLVQSIQAEHLRRLSEAITTSGFVVKGPIQGRPQNGTNAWKHTIRIENPVVLIKGQILHIGGGTNQFQPNATMNIWQMLSGGNESVSYFIIGDGPATGSRDDLVFLEVWEELITGESYIPRHGNTQYAGTPIPNDLVDPNIGRETSRRTQLKYRYRYVEGVDFLSFRNGVDHPSVFAQGSKTTPAVGYTFQKTPQGHYIAGNGTNTDASALGTVDGHVYALPICAVHRRNKASYSSLNLNGGAKKIEELVSDRPDGVFMDEIATHEIEDLRNAVEFSVNLEALAEKSIREVFEGQGKRLALGNRPELFSTKNIQVDGIAATERAGVADNLRRKPNAVRRSFSDQEITQRTTYYVQTGALEGGRFKLEPPVFYSVADTPEYQDFNPFIGIKTLPRIINAATGNVIAPDSSEGLSGWTNLGDRLEKRAAYFKPSSNSDILGKQILVEYDLVMPSGSGLTGLPEDFFSIRDDLNSKEVVWTRDGQTREIKTTRTVGIYADSAFARPIRAFLGAGTQNESYKAGLVERVWYTVGNGTAKVTVPATIDGMTVLTVLRAQFAESGDGTAGIDIPLGFGLTPKIIRKADGSFEVNFQSYFPSANDTVKLTLLLGGTGVEVITPHKALTNWSRTTYITITSTGALSYDIRQATIAANKMEYIYAVGGYQDAGNEFRYSCFVSDTSSSDGNWTEIDTVEGLNTATIKITFLVAPPAGKTIRVPVIGTYAPSAADLYSVSYTTIPYQGLSNTLADNETIEADLLHLSEYMIVTSNGTGGLIKNDHEDGKTLRMPINALDSDHEFENRNINLPFIAIRGATNKTHIAYSFAQGTKALEEGDRIVLKKISAGQNNYPARGLALVSPQISMVGGRTEAEVMEDLSTQTGSSNRVFFTQSPILSVYGTYALSRTFQPQGIAIFANGSQTVNGVGALFTRQLRAGMRIRPVGTTDWFTIHRVESDTVVQLRTAYSGVNSTGGFELYVPDIKVFADGVELEPNDIEEVRGKDGVIVLSSAPTTATELRVQYRTGQNTMNIMYGIAQGRGSYEGELLLFCLTSTSSAEWVASPEFNLLKEGKANALIIHNNATVVSTTGLKNEANRILGAAEFYYPADRITKVRTKVD